MPTQVKSNHAIYLQEFRKEAERDHHGEAALMVDGEIIDYFPDGGAAYEAGYNRFGLGNFSIEFVGAEPVDLRFQTLGIL